ncbi:hypothetical protein ACRGHN_000892 [Escherichia coli]
MVNLPPELGSPDVWAGGGIGLIAGLLLRYVIVRVFIVFRLFGREWSFDLKDRTSVNAKIIGRFSPFLMSAIGH